MNKIDNVEKFLEIVTQLLLETLQIEKTNIPITLKTDLVSGIGMDSLSLSSIDYVDFIIKIEEEFDITFDFNTVIYSVGDLYNYIKAYQKGNNNNE